MIFCPMILLPGRADHSDVTTEVKVVIAAPTGEDRCCDSATRCEQQGRQSTATDALHARQCKARAACSRRCLSGSVLRTGSDLRDLASSAKLNLTNLRGDDCIAALSVNRESVGLRVVGNHRSVLGVDGCGDASRYGYAGTSRLKNTRDARLAKAHLHDCAR